MEYSISQHYFLNELALAARAISSKTTIPVLTGIKFDVKEEGIYLTSSNSDITIKTFIDAASEDAKLEIHQIGGLILPASRFIEMVKLIPNDIITIKLLDNDVVLIKGGSTEYKLQGEPLDAYPRLPEFNAEKTFKIDVNILEKTVNQTSFSALNNEFRPILTGIHFTVKNSLLTVAATDGHRMSKVSLNNSDIEDIDFVIPKKNITELIRSLDNAEDKIEVSVTENQVLFNAGNFEFYSRLLQGNYPDVDRIVPTEFSTTIEFSRQKLRDSLKRASIFFTENGDNRIILEITTDDIQLFTQSRSADNYEEYLTYENIKGDPLKISFNPNYVDAALNAIDTDNVIIKFVSSTMPFVILPKSEDLNENFIQLVTPIRISE
ncbi:MAG: DNA polymerase III subunit beta [Lactobacillales bacterium]|jgi:DNA polymerase-3 subunit beta|nr:DNA polymerase III subunit beta [Lactobacillales bacterium]